MIWHPPTVEEIGVSTLHAWRSTCGHCRIARITGPEPRFMVAYQPDGAMERLVANENHWVKRRVERVLPRNARAREERSVDQGAATSREQGKGGCFPFTRVPLRR